MLVSDSLFLLSKTEERITGVYGVLFVTGMFATTYSIVNMVKVRKHKTLVSTLDLHVLQLSLGK